VSKVNNSAITIKKCVEEFASYESLKRKKQKEKVFTKGVLYDFSDQVTAEWYIADLFDITNLITCGVAKRPDYVDEGIPFLSAQNARPFKTNLNKIRYIDEDTFNKITVGGKPEKGDILYTRVGNCGEAATIPYDFDFGVYVSLTLIKPNKLFLDSDYLTAFLNSRFGVMQASQGAIGSGLKNLNVDNVRRYKIPLPPIAEQKRIVEKLDSLLAQVDTIKQRLNNLPKIIKRFRQSVLAAAVSGKLTEQWRIEKEFDNWNTLNFEYLILESGNGLSKRRGEEGTETTILRLADFKDAVRVKGKERQISLTDKEVEKYTLHNDDILVIRVNGSIDLAGKFILYTKETDCEGYCDHFIRIKINTEKAIPKFITYIANEGIGRHYLVNSLSTSAGQNTINQKSIKALKINLPSLEEQTEIVRLVEQHFALADTLEKNLKNAKQKVDSLTQSILAKAFRGELVPQDPNDEPAEQLLARIKTARAEAELLEKAAKKVTSKTKRQKGVVS
jgi:type I restriction enzyme S subunit